MSADLQKRFRELASGERIYVGGKFATQNDLSALFTVRAYLSICGPAGASPLSCRLRRRLRAVREVPQRLFSSARIAWDEGGR